MRYVADANMVNNNNNSNNVGDGVYARRRYLGLPAVTKAFDGINHYALFQKLIEHLSLRMVMT